MKEFKNYTNTELKETIISFDKLNYFLQLAKTPNNTTEAMKEKVLRMKQELRNRNLKQLGI